MATTYINNNGAIEIYSDALPLELKRYYFGLDGTSGKFYPMKNHKYLIKIGGDNYELLWQDMNIGGITPITFKDAGRLLGEVFTSGTTTSPISPSETTLKVTQSSNFDIGLSTDFTIEWFMYLTGSAYFPRIYSIGAYPSASHAVSIEGGSLLWWANSGVQLQTDTLPDLLFKWHHVAIVRNSNVVTVYFNGIPSVSTEYPNDIACTSDLYIGSENVSETYFDGKISNFRWTNSYALYTEQFTPPTAPLSSIPGAPIVGSELLFLQGDSQENQYTDNSEAINTIENLGTKYSQDSPFVGYPGSTLFGNY